MTYHCEKCGGVLEYISMDFEHGEHHECTECGEVYPYE